MAKALLLILCLQIFVLKDSTQHVLLGKVCFGAGVSLKLACAFFHTGAFNAFDKDGDGIIKLNVLEVKPNRSSTLPLHLKIQGGV